MHKTGASINAPNLHKAGIHHGMPKDFERILRHFMKL